MSGNACRVCKDGLFRYSLTRTQQIALLEQQNNKCQICNKVVELFAGPKGGFVDHDHKTGEVRGILCNRCNTIVGGIENLDNIERLLAYLKL
jgi:hypothetical protein